MSDVAPELTPLPPKWTGKFRRKPDVTVEAVQWDGTVTRATDLINWILASDGCARYHDDPSALSINTPHGTRTAVPGDWIIRHRAGVFWSCPDDEFRAACDPAAADGQPAPGLAEARRQLGKMILTADQIATQRDDARTVVTEMIAYLRRGMTTSSGFEGQLADWERRARLEQDGESPLATAIDVDESWRPGEGGVMETAP